MKYREADLTLCLEDSIIKAQIREYLYVISVADQLQSDCCNMNVLRTIVRYRNPFAFHLDI